jgi:tRNA(Ile)-lysidine synthase
VVDFDQVAGPLFVRAPTVGDRFDPLGMGGRHMILADFFRGRRVPPDRRVRTPLVCDDLGIVWVAGHRIAERVKETSHTARRLTLRLEQGSSRHDEGQEDGQTTTITSRAREGHLN